MKVIKKFFHIIFWGLLIAGVVLTIGIMEQKHSDTVCESFELLVQNADENALTDEAEIRAQIIAATDTLTGKTLGEIEPLLIHKVLDNNPYVKYADVQTGIDGRMKVDVTLRNAIVRVINARGLCYYIDEDGWIMPTNAGHSSRVLVMSGYIKGGISQENLTNLHIDHLSDGSVVREIFNLSVYINQDKFLKRLIGQVYVDSHGELEFSPLIGDYTICFGGFEDMKEKFKKLLAYYHEGAGKAGWIAYHSIDLRYKNQVICSK